MKRTTISTVCFLISILFYAQDNQPLSIEEIENRVRSIEDKLAESKSLKISGYIQTQFQWGEESASLKVGSANENPEKSFSRFGIRRSRIKVAYEKSLASAVFQLDFTEKGIGLKDAYLNVKDPWINTLTLRAGIFDRPFGNEISYSSSRRESPERSTIFQTLFPEERDLGVMLVLQAPKTSPWNILKLEAGLFAGNGIKKETDSRKDIISHLSLNNNIGNSISYGLGASYYNGGVYQGTDLVYTMNNNGFTIDRRDYNIGEYAKREYIGFDGQFAFAGPFGMTQLRAEYLFGKQPGTDLSTQSPNSSSLPEADTYIRNFNGGYVILVQDIGNLPFSAVVKYDWYDPNTDISGNLVGLNDTGKTDLSQNTIGLGALWRINNNLRLQVFYEINNNEKTDQIEGLNENIKNDVFTLRLQYKF